MTNDDELLKRLDKGVLRHKDGFVKFNQACRDMEEAAARIRELMPLLQFAKATSFEQREGVLNGTHVIVLASDWELYRDFHDGVCKTGTHVVVPVEPTGQMLEDGVYSLIVSGLDGIDGVGHEDAKRVYKAMIKAAQEGDNG